MYWKNTHTNIWEKPAWKKTRIQMYEKNPHANVWKNTHTNTHTDIWKKHGYKCVKKTNAWQKYTHILDSQFQHPGGIGHVSCGKEVNCQPSSCQPAIHLFEQWVNCEPSSYWTTTLTTEPWPPQIQTYTCMRKTRIQMYEKKHAYKCMKKTHTNTHKNVWKKTGIPMYEKNTQTNVWKKHA